MEFSRVKNFVWKSSGINKEFMQILEQKVSFEENLLGYTQNLWKP